MANYHVYLPPETNTTQRGALLPPAFEEARFLIGGKSLLALAFPLIFLIWNRLWFELAVYVAFGIVISVISITDFAAFAAAITFIPGLYLFLEGRDLVRTKWENKGWRCIDLIEAGSLEAAEIRFFHEHQTQEKPLAPPPLPNTLPRRTPRNGSSSANQEQAFGMFGQGYVN